MTSEQLKERIAKVEEKIAKKNNTIVKKTNLITKKEEKLKKENDEHESYWLQCEINNLTDDIKRLNREIEESNVTLENYKLKLKEEEEKENLIATEMPNEFLELKEALVKDWDEFDIKQRDARRIEHKELGYKEFVKKYSYAAYEALHETDEEIHKSNEKAAEALILNLYNRVKKITGKVTDWNYIRLESGNGGFPVLTGFVKGEDGTALVETILAGGYNIQRLHIRTLVKKL